MTLTDVYDFIAATEKLITTNISIKR